MKISLSNRLPVLLRERGLSGASAFARQMTAAGYPISESNAARYTKQMPPSVDLTFHMIACGVLRCLPDAFYDILIELAPSEELDPRTVLPRHAVVIRRDVAVGACAPRVIPNPTPAVPPLPTPSASAAVSARQKPPAAARNKTPSVGPSGSIFPFLKP